MIPIALVATIITVIQDSNENYALVVAIFTD